jgi:hypothetical protein
MEPIKSARFLDLPPELGLFFNCISNSPDECREDSYSLEFLDDLVVIFKDFMKVFI